ncbi:hypothetical protein JB92DRAFT_2842640 [Gautieria morchelliformis]|nr:hypothetical protein JB92DRAFT_2842640 [Gautieria morchelliformis]
MAIPTHTKAWILQNKPETAVNFSSTGDATFALKTLEIPPLVPEDSLLVKIIWISNDPAQRGWIQKGMDPKRSYSRPVEEGEIMPSRALAQVIVVGGLSDTHKEADIVLTSTGWAEYSVVKKAASQVINPIPGVPLSAFLGPLGHPGLTAYWGLVDVLKIQAGETIIVSGAAGAVGNVVVQLAKNVFGAKKVVAIVGSNDKAEYVRSLGADVALNYKSPQFEKELTEATPGYSEIFFDNVGGHILHLVLTRLKRHGRIAACGAISNYKHRPEGLQALISALEENKLMVKGGETVVEVSGLEDIPKVWHRLFEGKNQGKLLTKLP